MAKIFRKDVDTQRISSHTPFRISTGVERFGVSGEQNVETRNSWRNSDRWARHLWFCIRNLNNGSFEIDSYPTWPGYSNSGSNGGITDWTVTGGVGLNPTTDPGPTYPCCGPAPFGPGAPGVTASPDGGQWAFIQSAGGSISQTITGLHVGVKYEITYYDSHRNGDSGPGDTLIASIDSTVELTTTPNLTWQARSFDFVAAATSQALSFTHGNLTGDQTVTFDGVKIAYAPEPASLALLGIGSIGLIARRRGA